MEQKTVSMYVVDSAESINILMHLEYILKTVTQNDLRFGLTAID